MQLTFNHPQNNHHLFHHGIFREHEHGWMLISIYGVRMEALVVATCLWVMLTLTTGIFTVAMVVLIGAAVGNAHHLLDKMPCEAHSVSALLVTLTGGFVANVLAGLAMFSNRMGVSYGEVLSSRQIPEDLPMLFDTFVESFRPEDVFFYVLAAVVAMISARHLEPWWKQTVKRKKG